MIIYCCECKKDIEARLTSGKEIYPHRKDLYSLPFWICDACLNYVGTHHKTKNRTRPLGVIPNEGMRSARKKIHAILDPLWKSGKIKRRTLYKNIRDHLGKEYHTANIKNIEEANEVLSYITQVADVVCNNGRTKE
jgi:hypothetical protein